MADYPRLLNLDEDTSERLLSFLREELLNHRAERQNFMDNLMAWQKDYWAKPSTDVKTFPFYGASNLIVPLSAISVEAVFARQMTKFFAIHPIVNATLKVSGMPTGTEQAFEKYIDHELMHAIRFKHAASNLSLETIKFGTGVGRAGYERLVRKSIQTIGDVEIERKVITKQSATIDPVPVARFLMPFQFQDPQTALWCGEEHSKSPYEVKQLDQSGLFYKGTYEHLLAWVNQGRISSEAASGTQFTENQETLEEKEPVFPKYIDFAEIWLGFDVDGDDFDEEIQVYYHEESNTLMAARYNWRDDLSRPYRYSNYIPVEHRWNGIGVCKQNEQFQREITTMHRQRLDNATLANMRMFKIHKLSGYGPKEPVFPGKMWFVDDMTHIEAFQVGEIYQSAFANEQSSLIYSQQRTGVNEVILGMPQVGTPGTATGDLARIQEGNKKFDYAYDSQRDTLNALIFDAILYIHQFGSRDMEYFDFVEGGDLVRQLFGYPADQIRRGLIFDITLAGQQGNKLMDRQAWQEVTVILQQYFTSLLQLASNIGDPQLLAAIIRKAMLAANEVLRQLLNSYDILNADRIVVRELETMLSETQNAIQRPNLALVPGGTGRNQGNGGQQGMGAIGGIPTAVGR